MVSLEIRLKKIQENHVFPKIVPGVWRKGKENTCIYVHDKVNIYTGIKL